MNYIEKIDDFFKKKSELPKMVIIYGPTASGKTAMSINIAKKLNSEIISTDSRQIFRESNIGTAKITLEEMDGIKHHMVDICNLDEEFSVGAYKKQSEKIIENLYKQNKIPILAGGTGLYIDSIIYDFEIPEILADKNLREKLEQEAKEFGVDFVYEQLKKIDPENYEKVHKNNVQYVIRAIEVKILSGKSKYENPVKKKLKYDVLFLTPYTGDREKLYSRIDLRVDLMFEKGLEEEIQSLIRKGYSRKSFGLKSIGYTEYFDYLEGVYSYEEMIEKIKQHSRNYAKRQLTWFRKYENTN
ncbi:MAG: tRNA (adenosine(37)-N6)-dimethylallyltransferase MiaA [Candidatus Gracilibacteria bacterium]|nr:tRNA (adenosine(37)-N6)-dimethylallyltransferase MiaA [Candidatus Gracilibacteria bacterium]MDQ7023355.1 tRNA (adenosine(37)-N6)-dimethylallyltransferase MiaA [Candidatus Gracilibacteria bacterium]